MIQNVRNTGRRIKVRASDRLRVHFLSLARRVATWRQAASFNDGVVVGVTSVEPKAGRSVVGFNLASSLASIGQENVLFVETQFGTPEVSRRAPRPGYGLSEVINGKEPLSECICTTNVDRLFVLGCGRASAKQSVELPFEALESINAELCSSFSYVIYDLPLADEMTHCFPIAQFADGVLIVNSTSDIQEDRIHRASRRFDEMSKPVIGLVLNKA